ncbi:hypothetical protein [Antribacter gilvus]|uniref:hypothetical protein n=1 Tax=Antribacter gilvus TaxID=2304675 RepID=UPI000F7A5B6D|nr:hypothetical protein [Antribacter gilvus]
MTVAPQARAGVQPRLAVALLLAVVVGVAFAIGTVMLNHGEHVVLRGVATVVGAASGWAAAGVVFGWVMLRRGASAARTVLLCTAFFVSASVGYYVADYLYALATSEPPLPPGVPLLPGAMASTTPQLSIGEMSFWVVASLVCGPACAAVAWLAGRPGVLGLLGGLCLPVGAALWSAFMLTDRFSIPVRLPNLVAHWAVVALCVIGAGVLVVRYVARARATLAQ